MDEVKPSNIRSSIGEDGKKASDKCEKPVSSKPSSPVEIKLGSEPGSAKQESGVSPSGSLQSGGTEASEIRRQVGELKCSEVRWFYRKEKAEKWTPFKGYDSIVLEVAYRKRKGIKVDEDTQARNNLPCTEDVIVLNGLYQFVERETEKGELSSIYYKQDAFEVCRGTWFYVDSMQPLAGDIAEAIEEHHLKTFRGHSIPDSSAVSELEFSKFNVLSSLKWSNEEVRWHSTTDASIINHRKGSRIIRFVTRSKGTSYIRRAYSEGALFEEGMPNFSDLILVVHGIGQKGNENLIAENTTQIREGVLHLMEKNYPGENRRPIILPIEWRSSLTLDSGMTDVVTLPRVPSVRTALNSVAMDIMYYQSPLYRTEIVNGVICQLNSIYSVFKRNNPTFQGAVSIYAHSLGSVIVYDILTNWSHCAFYDEFVTKAIKDYIDGCEEENDERRLLENFYNSRRSLSDAGGVMKQVLAAQEKQLDFKVKNLFSVGSPLAVFIIMRGADYKSVVPKPEQVERIFNIFHPFDPVAYRLEPLFHENYRHIRPLKLLSYGEAKESYDQMLFDCHKSYLKRKKKAEKSKRDGVCENINFEDNAPVENVDLGSDKDDDSPASSPLCASPKKDHSKPPNDRDSACLPSSQDSKPVRNWYKPSKTVVERANAKEDVESSDERTAAGESNDPTTDTCTGVELLKKMGEAGKLIEAIETDRRIPYRMDYQIKPGLTEKTYWSVLKSHFAYWTNLDVTEFVLNTLYQQSPPEDVDKGNRPASSKE